jgi:CSLREA domain-containing protein
MLDAAPLRSSCTFALAVVVQLVVAAAVQGAAIVVDTTADVADGGDGECSLREAITAANSDSASGIVPGECAAGSGPDTIQFAIPGLGPHTIEVASTMPFVTTPIVIDGLTQSGAACPDGLRIEVVAAGGEEGGTPFVFFPPGSAGSLLRGIAVNGFSSGNAVQTSTPITVQCNLFGLHPDGTPATGNGYGVYVATSAGATIIGTNGDGSNDAGEGNVFAFSVTAGITVESVDGLVVAGNRFGVDLDGLAAANGTGIFGSTFFCPDAIRIGSDFDGVSDAFETNWIAHNVNGGVSLDACAVASLRGNRFEENGGTGYTSFGGSATDDPDVDGLPNSPVLDGFEVDAASERARVELSVPSDPADVDYPLSVDLYVADADDQEGRIWLGAVSFVAFDFANGSATKELDLPTGEVPAPGAAIVATSTTSSGDTSLFGVPVIAVAGDVPGPLFANGFEDGFTGWSAVVGGP